MNWLLTLEVATDKQEKQTHEVRVYGAARDCATQLRPAGRLPHG